MKVIESRSNSYFKVLQKLVKASGIKKERLFLVMGPKIVSEYMHLDTVKSILVTAESTAVDSRLKKKVVQLSNDLFKELDIYETQSPILVMELPKISIWNGQKPQGLELFVPAQDPANLGAIVRSAVGFGVSKVVLLKEAAHPFHPKAIKASSGMVLKAKFEVGPSIHELHKQIKDYVSLDGEGASLENFNWPKNISLVVGEEGMGLPESLKTNSVAIPISTECESLNVMAAASIALYDYSKKVVSKGNITK